MTRRRILSVSIFLGMLVLGLLLASNRSAFALTTTPTPTGFVGNISIGGTVKDAVTGLPIVGATVTCVHNVLVSHSPLCTGTRTTSSTGTYSFGVAFIRDTDTVSVTVDAAGYTSQTISRNGISMMGGGSFNFAMVASGPTVTPTSIPGQPDLSFPATPYWMWDPGSYDSANSCYNYTPVLVWNVQVKNAGSANAGSFVVGQNYDAQKAVSGLPAGQTSTLYFPFPGRPGATAPAGQPTLSTMYSNFAADTTNTVVESNETNNTSRAAIPVFTATLSSGATRVYCKTSTPTPTGSLPAPTFTRTPTPSPTCPCISPTPTRTSTRTLTPTITSTTPTGGTCSPVNATITAPFSWDGAGTLCWQSSNLGSYINNWSTTSVTLNGVNITNMYIPSSSYPAKIGGFWYISLNSAVTWGHFEAK